MKGSRYVTQKITSRGKIIVVQNDWKSKISKTFRKEKWTVMKIYAVGKTWN